MTSLGFVKEAGWIESEVKFPDKGDPMYDRFIKLGAYVKKRYNLTEVCEKMSMKQIVKKYGDSFFRCYNDAYKKLDMFVEIKDEAKKQVLDQFAIMINKEFFSVLVDENDEVVAFTVLLPAFGKVMKKHGGKISLPFIFDLKKCLDKPETLELTLIAVRPEYLKKGYNAGGIARIIENVAKHKIKRILSLPTLESNTAVRAQWSNLESKDVKTRQTYIKNF
jgi:hypothetical protein